jgi:cytochrome d ubiquinol oxidase subunit II
MFPTLLRSTLDPAFSLDARGAAAGAHGLSTGLAWAFVGLPLAVAYAVTLFRSFAGKAKAEPHGY